MSDEGDSAEDEIEPLPEWAQLDEPDDYGRETSTPEPEPLEPEPDPHADLRAAVDAVAVGVKRRDLDAEELARSALTTGRDRRAELGRLAEWGIALSGAGDAWPPRPLSPAAVIVTSDGTAPPSLVRSEDLAGISSYHLAVQGFSTSAEIVTAAGALVDEAVDAGATVLIPVTRVEPAVSGALVRTLLRLSVLDAVGDADHLDDTAWAELVVAVRERSRDLREVDDDVLAVLDGVGSPETTALAALCLRAAARRTTVLLDGVADTAAALAASRVAILASWWCLASTSSPDPALTRAQDALGLTPMVDLEARLDAGAGALAALPLLERAVAAMRSAATT